MTISFLRETVHLVTVKLNVTLQLEYVMMKSYYEHNEEGLCVPCSDGMYGGQCDRNVAVKIKIKFVIKYQELVQNAPRSLLIKLV